MVARITTIAFSGVDVQSIDVQVQISNGLPAFTIVGYILLLFTLSFSCPAKAQNSQVISDKELSQIYQNGDFEKMRIFAESGNAKAQMWLGMMYRHQANHKEAIKWLALAGNKGEPNAITQAAFMHKYGVGMPKSEAMATEWYKKGAEFGNANLQMNYASALLEGNGVKKNEKEAFGWFLKAANQNNVDAYYMLADLTSKGIGTQYEPIKAYAYVRYFLEHGFIDSLDNRDTESYKIEKNMKKQLSKDQKIESDKLLDELNKNGR